ncbi:MAG: hypothetical protein JNL79_31975 [Myxococcales bacterium]|nr:hypothetical protein [Myxococcales bacterium]
MSDAKNRILARRAKFVTAALTTVLAACGSSTTEEAKDTGTGSEVGTDGGADTGPVPCLDMPPPDTGTLDTGGLDTGSLDSSAADSGGVRDSADEDTGPTPCLKVPLDTGTD